MTIPFYHGHYTETLHVLWSHFHKGSENTAGYSHHWFLAALWRGRPEVHPLILTKPAKNSSSFLTITGKSHVHQSSQTIHRKSGVDTRPVQGTEGNAAALARSPFRFSPVMRE